MSVFITLTTDSFAENFRITSDNKADTRRAGTDRARRPLRGIEIKDDTYAYLKLIRSDGSEIPLVDGSSPDGENRQYSNFILQSVSEARMEKHQIVETFGEPYIYFFGESPRFLDVQAVLIDSLDFNWYAEFWENYNRYLRGTRSVELGARTYLFYNDNVVEGYILMAQAQESADQPWQARLSFRMYLTNYSNVTFVGDPSYPVRANINLPPSVDLTTTDAFSVAHDAATAAGQAQLDESRAIQAATGARQQASGFGGGRKLSDALRSGAAPTGDLNVDGVLRNALDALMNAGTRSKPLRGLIADNFDEFTALPAPPPNTPTQEQDHDGQVEAEDIPTAATTKANEHGADINNPNMLSRLGLGPYFSTQQGFGVRGGSVLGASFGVASVGQSGAGFRGGINGGLGFTGVFTASSINGVSSKTASLGTVPVGASPFNGSPFGVSPFDPRANAFNANNPALLNQQNALQPVGGNIFGNGIVVYGGVSQGTGIGGGIPGGVSGGIGPNGPGTLPQFAGGQSFATPNGFSSMQGYGNGLSSNGAVVNVPGAPSAFATVAAPGTLYPNGFPPYGPPPLGTATGVFFIGPDGVSSKTNSTGIFA